MRGRTPLVLLVAFVVNLFVVPRACSDPEARRLLAGDRDTLVAFADPLAVRAEVASGPVWYDTSYLRFDGQSAVAIDQMTLLALSQVVDRHPDLRERYLPAMQAAGDRLADPAQLVYAARAYGTSGLSGAFGKGHAYLGYVAMGLGALRRHDPNTRHADLHDRLLAELRRQLRASHDGLIETYPGELWPPDVAAVAGAIGLHAQTMGTAHGLDDWLVRFRACAIEPATGMLRQAVVRTAKGCRGTPRGSGTAVGAYFLSFVDPKLARELEASLPERGFVGFGGVREYPPGFDGSGDNNSGPVVLGISIGATGFGIGAARAAGDDEGFLRLYRTAWLFGVSTRHPRGRTFAVGGALGNALLVAMLTAEPK